MKTQTLNMRIDPETKMQAEKVYAQFGITLSDAINMFLNKSIMTGGLPFKLVPPPFDRETEEAIKRADDDIANGRVYTHEEVFGKLRAKAQRLKDGLR